ncbi:MAG: OsmC family protein [Syntrophomonas sp.]|nr:OsmC family protein [Syntrophomonas sp.]
MATIKISKESYGMYNETGFLSELNGINPKDLFESSLALCIMITLQKIFERDAIIVHDDEITVAVEAQKAIDRPSRFESCKVKITLPQRLPNEYKKKIAVQAERACFIGNTLKRGIAIYTD